MLFSLESAGNGQGKLSMNVIEAKKKFGEKLGAIESLSESAHAHYLRVEDAISRASTNEVQAHYGYLHGGMLPEEVVADPRFPWHPQYKYGDAKKCCDNCEELEMALAVNLMNAGEGHPLAASLPDLGKLATEAAITG